MMERKQGRKVGGKGRRKEVGEESEDGKSGRMGGTKGCKMK